MLVVVAAMLLVLVISDCDDRIMFFPRGVVISSKSKKANKSNVNSNRGNLTKQSPEQDLVHAYS